MDEKRDKPEEKEEEEEGVMTPLQIQREIDQLRGKIPSFILKDLSDSLKHRNVTQYQFDQIKEKLVEQIEGGRLDTRIDKITDQVNRLATTIESIGKFLAGEQVQLPFGEEPPGEELPTAEEGEGVAPPEEGEKKGALGEKVEGIKTLQLPGLRGRPRLTEIKNDAISSRILIEWIEFLIKKVGVDGMVDVLAYYVDLGWISAEVLLKVVRYAKGLKNWQERGNVKPQGYLTPADHIRTLMYIEELRRGAERERGKENGREGNLEEEISKVYRYGWRR